VTSCETPDIILNNPVLSLILVGRGLYSFETLRCTELQIWLKSDKNTGHVTLKPDYVLLLPAA